ncbi:MAG: YeeE/YedE family protein, partial [Deltaproteobacteria bacterium]
GQVKLMLVVPFFSLSNALMTAWFKMEKFEAEGVLGKKIYLPDALGGYGPTLLLLFVVLAVWYIIVTWNEESNKLIVPM